MIKQKWLRFTLGILLGGFAGLSLTSSILPAAMTTFYADVDAMFVRFSLADYAAHAVLLWAAGGWAVAKVGHSLPGAIVLGIVGLVSGVFLGYAALGTDGATLIIAGAASLLYGVVGGLMLGGVLRSPDETGGQGLRDGG
ncbi:hypothetical protein DESUT3_09040 [Desulfuromonas versatilis]|uniref:DUF423 domain-containing protein n=1 Tax=Desulfuromonas versatilis TaxID=2802975 RepID=A0ABM8HT19_9BACT|nr:hypothetical protein [Desulfuromonas versatilis]BCR03835.1 hypothetical protein DESUT3_09040 [Desulfuromonas versatilis]